MTFTKQEMAMIAMWERHTNAEFIERSADAALATMNACPHVMHVPTLTGGYGREGVHYFYTNYFIPYQDPKTETELLTRTVGQNRIIDEFIFKFTHCMEMPWILPGVAPTHKKIEIPFVAIIQFDEDKIASEHIYWDQAALLAQLGLLDPKTLPITTTESIHRLKNPALPANPLIEKHLKK